MVIDMKINNIKLWNINKLNEQFIKELRDKIKEKYDNEYLIVYDGYGDKSLSGNNRYEIKINKYAFPYKYTINKPYEIHLKYIPCKTISVIEEYGMLCARKAGDSFDFIYEYSDKNLYAPIQYKVSGKFSVIEDMYINISNPQLLIVNSIYSHLSFILFNQSEQFMKDKLHGKTIKDNNLIPLSTLFVTQLFNMIVYSMNELLDNYVNIN
jgi:hypothetical protein